MLGEVQWLPYRTLKPNQCGILIHGDFGWARGTPLRPDSGRVYASAGAAMSWSTVSIQRCSSAIVGGSSYGWA